MKIYLIGMPGSGKSTIGRPLAERLAVPFFDLDQIIEQEEGMAVRNIFAAKGEDHFRDLERHLLERTTNTHSDFVLSTGGGTPCFFENLQKMKEQGTVVFISVLIKNLVNRLRKDGLAKRPLLKDYPNAAQLEEYLLNTYNKRLAFYEQADLHFETHQTIEELVDVIKTLKN